MPGAAGIDNVISINAQSGTIALEVGGWNFGIRAEQKKYRSLWWFRHETFIRPKPPSSHHLIMTRLNGLMNRIVTGNRNRTSFVERSRRDVDRSCFQSTTVETAGWIAFWKLPPATHGHFQENIASFNDA